MLSLLPLLFPALPPDEAPLLPPLEDELEELLELPELDEMLVATAAAVEMAVAVTVTVSIGYVTIPD